MQESANQGPPWAIGALLGRLARVGAEELASELGPFVLVGSTRRDDEESGWSFATQAVRPIDVGSAGSRLDGSTVHPLRKRGSTFAGTILVGRSSSNDVCIEDSTISKLHARIRLDTDGFWLEDAGSRNGTFVEGERVRTEEAQVYPGDTVRFGTCSFMVQSTPRFLDLLARMTRGR